MQRFNTLDDAIRLAKFIHHKQVDKLGEPYFGHVYRVYQNVAAQGASIDVQIAAVLHDSTEDSKFTAQMLIDLGVPEAAVAIVKLLDRSYSAAVLGSDWIDKLTDEDYQLLSSSNPNRAEDDKRLRKIVYDNYYYEQIRKNPGALIVKKADIGDNTQPWRLEYLDKPTQERLRAKYAKALELLA